MAEHYNDTEYNSYVDGLGSEMPQNHQPGALAKKSNKINRETCGIHLKHIPVALTETGIRNLCIKYGQVVEVRLIRKEYCPPFANVKYASAE